MKYAVLHITEGEYLNILSENKQKMAVFNTREEADKEICWLCTSLGLMYDINIYADEFEIEEIEEGEI